MARMSIEMSADAPAEYAGRMIRAWKRYRSCEADAARQTSGSDAAIHRANRAVRTFGRVVARAACAPSFDETLAMARSLAASHGDLTLTPHDLGCMLGAVANVHGSMGYTPPHRQGLRSVLFGIPVQGSPSAVHALAGGEFMTLLRTSGWLPPTANIRCLAALSLPATLALSQDPARVWTLSRAIVAGLEDELQACLAGLRTDGNKRPPTRVLLVSATAPLTVTSLPMVDEVPDAIHDDACARWFAAFATFAQGHASTGLTAICHPAPLNAAAMMGFASDAAHALDRALENHQGQAEGPPATALVRNTAGRIDLVARLADGTELTLRAALPDAAWPWLEDIAGWMAKDTPVAVLSAPDPLPWRLAPHTVQAPPPRHRFN